MPRGNKPSGGYSRGRRRGHVDQANARDRMSWNGPSDPRLVYGAGRSRFGEEANEDGAEETTRATQGEPDTTPENLAAAPPSSSEVVAAHDIQIVSTEGQDEAGLVTEIIETTPAAAEGIEAGGDIPTAAPETPVTPEVLNTPVQPEPQTWRRKVSRLHATPLSEKRAAEFAQFLSNFNFGFGREVLPDAGGLQDADLWELAETAQGIFEGTPLRFNPPHSLAEMRVSILTPVGVREAISVAARSKQRSLEPHQLQKLLESAWPADATEPYMASVGFVETLETKEAESRNVILGLRRDFFMPASGPDRERDDMLQTLREMYGYYIDLGSHCYFPIGTLRWNDAEAGYVPPEELLQQFTLAAFNTLATKKIFLGPLQTYERDKVSVTHPIRRRASQNPTVATFSPATTTPAPSTDYRRRVRSSRASNDAAPSISLHEYLGPMRKAESAIPPVDWFEGYSLVRPVVGSTVDQQALYGEVTQAFRRTVASADLGHLALQLHLVHTLGVPILGNGELRGLAAHTRLLMDYSAVDTKHQLTDALPASAQQEEAARITAARTLPRGNTSWLLMDVSLSDSVKNEIAASRRRLYELASTKEDKPDERRTAVPIARISSTNQLDRLALPGELRQELISALAPTIGKVIILGPMLDHAPGTGSAS